MQSIRGKQLIFTRVEKDYSPQRTSGYQIFYASNSLPTSDILFIQETIQGFDAKEVGDFHWQFFSTPSRSSVIAVTRLTKGHPSINDRYARDVLLSHCVIIHEQDFLALYGNPFIIFDHFNFIENAEDLVKNFNQLDQKELLCEFSPYDFEISHSNYIKRVGEATKLLSLFDYTNQYNKGPVQFIGPHKVFIDLLKVIFPLIPLEKRYLCSFDSYNPSLSKKATCFWALCSPERMLSTDFTYEIDSQQICPALPVFNSQNLYYQWMAYYSKELPHNEFINQVNDVQKINYAYENKVLLNKNDLGNKSCETFLQLHARIVKENIRVALIKWISDNLANKFKNYFYQSLSLSEKIIVGGAQTVQSKDVSKKLRKWFVSLAPKFADINKQDLKELINFSNAAKDVVLLFWGATILGEQNQTSSLINVMTAEDYEEALLLANNPIDIRNFFSKNHINSFMEQVQLKLGSITDDQVVSIIESTIIFEELKFLDVFILKLQTFDNKHLSIIEKKIKGLQNLPLGFTTAVAERRKQLGPSPNLLNTFLGRK